MVNIALLGCGTWGRNLLRALHQTPGARVTAVVDRAQSALAFVRSTYPEVDAEFEESVVLEDSQVAAVAIATPASDHARAVRAALKAGKHVFVEKPLAMTAADAQDLLSLAEEKRLVLMAGHTFLYNDAVRYVKRIIDSGDLGEIRYIYCQRLNLGVVRPDVNVLWNLGPHDISMLLYWLGAAPEKVAASGMCFLRPDLEDVAFIVMKFPNGVGAHVHLSWLDPKKVRSATIVGSKKMLVFDDASQEERVRIYDSGVDVERRLKEGENWATFGEFFLKHRSGDIITPAVPYREPLGNEMNEFISCIRSGKQPLTGGEHAYQVVKVLEEANRHMKLGR